MSCEERSTVAAPRLVGPLAQITDAAHSDGKPHFYFLPPMVRAPSVTGIFDPDLLPEVEITEQTKSTFQIRYTTASGPGSERVRLDATGEQYVVNWHTNEFDLDPNVTDRITVTVGGVLLGHADVGLVNSGGDLKNVDTDEFIPLVDGRTLPIKFRPERGFLARVVVTPETSTLSPGGVQRYGAIATDLHGTPVPASPIVWASSLQSVAVVDPNGVATAVSHGSATISAAAGGVSGIATLNVSEPLSLVDAGTFYACALTIAGQALCWGNGALGAASGQSFVPTRVDGGLRFASLSAGHFHACAVAVDGAAYCWGYTGSEGTLGTGGTSNSPTPVSVAGGLTFTAVSAGYAHTCGLDRGGLAYCWGRNPAGGLGTGTTESRLAPARVSGGLSFASLSAGVDRTCGVTNANAAYCWGSGASGALGTGSTADSYVPVPVAGELSFRSVSVGDRFTCGVTTNSDAYCWGDNAGGKLGTGTALNSLVPVRVAGGLAIASVSVGFSHACAISINQEAYCWGSYGALGTGTRDPSFVPVRVAGGHYFASISLGSSFTCGLTSGGAAYCWGDVSFGNFSWLGTGSRDGSLAPVAVAPIFP